MRMSVGERSGNDDEGRRGAKASPVNMVNPGYVPDSDPSW